MLVVRQLATVLVAGGNPPVGLSHELVLECTVAVIQIPF
jgi:hypothetical protein